MRRVIYRNTLIRILIHTHMPKAQPSRPASENGNKLSSILVGHSVFLNQCCRLLKNRLKMILFRILCAKSWLLLLVVCHCWNLNPIKSMANQFKNLLYMQTLVMISRGGDVIMKSIYAKIYTCNSQLWPSHTKKKTVQIHFFNHIVDNSFKNYKQIRCLQPIND